MEMYLFLALFLIYVLMALFVNKNTQKKIWTLAFIASFGITAISIGFLKVSSQDVMMSATELNWYYLLYLFGSLSVVLGLINLWMYRRPLWSVFFSGDEVEEETK